jgi:hypothetical protein
MEMVTLESIGHSSPGHRAVEYMMVIGTAYWRGLRGAWKRAL